MSSPSATLVTREQLPTKIMGLERCLIKNKRDRRISAISNSAHASIYIANSEVSGNFLSHGATIENWAALSLDNLTMAIGC